MLFDRRAAMCCAGAALVLPASGGAHVAGAAGYNAIVRKNSTGEALASLSAAISLAASSSVRPFRILLGNGVWEEKLTVDLPGLVIEGESRAAIISYGAAAGLSRPDGAKWGTFGSATLTIAARDVTLIGLTIRNSFDFLADRVSGASGGAQAVALALGAGADRILVRDCDISGYQDTLYVREGRALIEACRISGGTDFIFGGASALFSKCEIVSRAVPGAQVQGFIAAPSTHLAQEFGLVFDRCRLTRECGVADHSVYLGRPWRAGGNMALAGSAVFLNCWMDAHIKPEGWSAMGYRGPDGIQRMLEPQEARLFEISSHGPGAGAANKSRRFLPQDKADRYTAGNIWAIGSPRNH